MLGTWAILSTLCCSCQLALVCAVAQASSCTALGLGRCRARFYRPILPPLPHSIPFPSPQTTNGVVSFSAKDMPQDAATWARINSVPLCWATTYLRAAHSCRQASKQGILQAA